MNLGDVKEVAHSTVDGVGYPFVPYPTDS